MATCLRGSPCVSRAKIGGFLKPEVVLPGASSAALTLLLCIQPADVCRRLPGTTAQLLRIVNHTVM